VAGPARPLALTNSKLSSLLYLALNRSTCYPGGIEPGGGSSSCGKYIIISIPTSSSPFLPKSIHYPCKRPHFNIFSYGTLLGFDMRFSQDTRYTAALSSLTNPIYKPLDKNLRQIRVLILHAADSSDLLRVSLETISLLPHLASKTYQAISYCWNDAVVRKRMLLNGFEYDAPASAVEVLNRLRPAQETLTLWIDALCINQHDMAEREHQVTMMYDVYKGSLETIIWLGEQDEHTESAVLLCQAVRSQVREPFTADGSISEKQKHEFNNIKLPTNWKLNSLQSIFNRKWFTRQWVFQEVIASPQCVCRLGRFSTPWPAVDMAHAFLENTIHNDEMCQHDDVAEWFRVQRFLELPKNIRRFRALAARKQPLANAVIGTRCLEATDPRDNIYGVLSLVNSEDYRGSATTPIYPDYRRTARQIFPEVVRMMIQEGGSLVIITDKYLWPRPHIQEGHERWPSWVPRLDRPRPEWADSTLPFYTAFNACKSLPAVVGEFRAGMDPDVIYASGFRRGTVSAKVSFAGIDESWILPTVAEIYNTALRKESAERQVTSSITLYGTFIAGRFHDKGLSEAGGDVYRAFVDLMSHVPTTLANLRQRLKPLEYDLFMEIWKICHNRCFFFKDGGEYGLGPCDMEKGDVTAILLGLPWPIVLRPLRKGFKIIGPCFLFGIMEGEAVTELRNSGRRSAIEVFEIH
jgi:hypothetical protein